MANFEFVNHYDFPNDQYTKELVYLQFEGKYRIAYVRKKKQEGGMYWVPMSIGVDYCGKKEYFSSFIQDSNFLDRDIKDFLEKRSWENKSQSVSLPTMPSSSIPAFQSISIPANQINTDDLPF